MHLSFFRMPITTNESHKAEKNKKNSKFPTSIFPLFGYLYAFGKGKKTSNITLPSNRQMTVIVCGENQDEVA